VSVRRSVDVAIPPSAAFELFTDGIARWWPLHEGYSYGGDRAASIALEPRLGGRFFERFTDGDELQVGEVIACEPPGRIVFTWQAPGWAGATEVEVTFSGDDRRTRVEVEHRGWDRLGPEREGEAEGFGSGWPVVLGAYAAAASDVSAG
jgi:uncharacterized protein YndB with AHSA1/START domain